MTDDWLAIMPGALPIQQAIDHVKSPSAGGIDLFLGATRAEESHGRRLIALDYEAYTEMAQQQLGELASRARQQWPIIKLAILHRTGRVELGEPSVAIAVSTPHRAEAFAACRWIIDTLKKELAVWKKEVWDDGSGSWV